MNGDQMEEKTDNKLNVSFDNIIGEDAVKNSLINRLKQDIPGGAYLISGSRGSGKRMIAEAFAAGILCESNEKPCGFCRSCKLMRDHNHPDFIEISREKSYYSVSEIREQLNSAIEFAPRLGKKKVVFLEDAELLNTAAQNAMLKTIEEPPEYAVIIMTSCNPDLLLETVRSRVIELYTMPVPMETEAEYLMRKYKIPDYKAMEYASFSRGNIGEAQELMESASFKDVLEKTLTLTDKILNGKSDTEGLVKELSDKKAKDDIKAFLDLLRIWYRDVLIYKATGSDDYLIVRDEDMRIHEQAKKVGFEGLNNSFRIISETERRIQANMKMENAIGLMIMQLKENIGK